MTEDYIASRREREKLQRRQDIIDAATAIFARDGFDKASLDDIAERCELSKSALYYYFSSKEELFRSVIQKGFDELMEKIETAAQGATVRENVKDIVEAFINMRFSSCDLFKIAFHEKVKDFMEGKNDFIPIFDEKFEQIEGRLIKIFEKGIESGEVRKLDPHYLVHILFGVIHTFALGIKFNPPQGAEILTSVFFDGVKKS
jgi:AcrR family transcriptional regulator